MSLIRMFQRPVFGTVVIPPDARVDPGRFSEDDFPVKCTRCEYLLRGLPDGRCPECGEPFERGRLLVTEYAQWRVSQQKRYDRVMLWTAVVILTCLAVFRIVETSLIWQLKVAVAEARAPRQTAPLLNGFQTLEKVAGIIHWGLLAVVLTIVLRAYIGYRKRSRQRAQIISAIQTGVPAGLFTTEQHSG